MGEGAKEGIEGALFDGSTLWDPGKEGGEVLWVDVSKLGDVTGWEEAAVIAIGLFCYFGMHGSKALGRGGAVCCMDGKLGQVVLDCPHASVAVPSE